MNVDPFIDTAILAEQTVQNAQNLRDTALKALAQKAQWRISQTTPPDFELKLDLETAAVPLLDVFALPDAGGFPTRRIRLPADQADPYAVSELVKYVCLDGPISASEDGEAFDPSEDVLLYDNLTDELEGKIELE